MVVFMILDSKVVLIFMILESIMQLGSANFYDFRIYKAVRQC